MTLVKPKVYHGNIPLRHLNTFPYFPSVSSFRELKRQNWQNSKFARRSPFLYISLPSLHNYNVKMPNFTFYGGSEQTTMTFFFFSWILINSLLEFNPETFANIWRIERDAIRAIKFEAARIHFFTAVCVAVAILFITLIARKFRRKAAQSSAWTVTWERCVRSNLIIIIIIITSKSSHYSCPRSVYCRSIAFLLVV